MQHKIRSSWLTGFILLLLLAGSAKAINSNDPSEEFVVAYQNYQQAERLERSGKTAEAVTKYRFAESVLIDISNNNPNWQKPVVEYRLSKIRNNLARINPAITPTGSSNNEAGPITASQVTPLTPITEGISSEEISSKKTTDLPSISIIPPVGKGTSSDKDILQLQKQLKRTEIQLQQAHNDVADKTAELDRSKVSIVDMKSQLQKTEQQIADLKVDLLKTRSSNTQREETLKKSLHQLEGKVEALSADQEVMVEENGVLQRHLEEAANSLATGISNKNHLEQLQVEMNLEKNASVALHEKLITAQRERNAATEQATTLQQQLKQADVSLAATEKKNHEIELLQNQVTTLTQEDARKQKMLTDATEATKKLEESERSVINDLQNKLAETEANQSKLEETRKELEAHLKEATDEIASFKKSGADTIALQAQVTAINEELANSKKQLAEAQSSRADLEKSQKQAVSDLENKLQAAAGERDAMDAKKSILEKQLAEVNEKVKSLVAQTPSSSEAKAEVQRYQDELKAASLKLEESEKKIAALEKAQPEKDQLLQAKEKELAAVRQESEKFQKELLSAREKISSIQEEVRLKDDRYNELKKQFDQKNDELLALQKKGTPDATGQKIIAENELLKGIVLRELKEEAKRQQLRKLITEDLEKLKVNSDTLSLQLKKLAKPVKLTPEERLLFKDKPLSVAVAESTEEEGDDKVMVSVAASKKEKPTTEGISVPLESNISTNAIVPILSEKETNSVTSTNALSSTNTPSEGDKNKKADDKKETASSSEKYQTIVAKAKEQFEHQNYTEAEKSFQDALAISPNDYLTLSNLGVVEFQLGKMSEAETILKQACTQDQKKSFAFTTLGIVHYRQERFDDAEKVLRQAVGINEQDFTAHNYLGIVLAASGKNKAGENEIMKAIEINPDYADAHFNLAVIYATSKPPAKQMAKTHYKKATSLGAPPDTSLEKLLN